MPAPNAAVTNAVVASVVELSPGAAVGAAGTPVNVGDATGAPPAPVMSAVVRVTAPARPLKVVTPPPDDSAATTKAVVASCVVFVPGAGVGAAGTPVNVGDAFSAPPAALTSAADNVTAPVRLMNEVTPAAAEAATKAVVASCVVEVPGAAVGAVGTPVSGVLLRTPDPDTSAEVSTTAPVRVLNEETPPAVATAAATKAVVASCVLLVPGAAVGAVGFPLKAGDARIAPPAEVMSAVFSKTAPVRVLKLDTPAVDAVIACITNDVVAS